MGIETQIQAGGKSVLSYRYHYPSVSAFSAGIEEFEQSKTGGSRVYGRRSDEVQSGKSLLVNGDVSLVDQAQALIDRFNQEIPSLARTWHTSVAGFFPNVPAFLAGEPETMWRINNEESDRAPIRVWVGVMSSGAISDEDLIKRGAALAAFGMAISERRPVLLTPYYAMGNASGGHGGDKGALISWDLQSSPIVLSEVMACLAAPDVVRYLGWYACQDLMPASNGCWYPQFLEEKWMRQALGCEDQDVWLPSAMVTDELITDPIRWINREIAKHVSEEVEA